MRWVLVVLGVVGLELGSVAAQPDSLQHRFDRGNTAYSEGRYARAAETYRAILADGAESVALHYNLGNAYVRLDQLGPAIRHYEKARRLSGTDPRLEHNLEQARRRAGIYPDELPPRGLTDVVRDWSPRSLFVAGWMLIFVGLIAAVGWRDRAGWSSPRAPLLGGALLGGGLLVVVALATSYIQALDQRAVVVAEQAPLRPVPAADAAPDTTLPEGVLLEVRERRDEWSAVRGSNNRTGWVPTRTLGDV